MMTPTLPQWLATLILGATLIVTTEIAFRLARFALGKRPEMATDKESAGVGILLSGGLALLGLLVGFTFSMATDRFDARRMWVNEEANAIGTAYLRARLTVGPDKAALPTLWANYAEARLALSVSHDGLQERQALLDRAETIQTNIWQATQRESAAARDDITASLVEATNLAFDVAGSRRTAVEARIPPGIVWTVILYALVAAALLGHTLAFDRRRLFQSSALLLLVAMSIALIIDLDRPQSGVVRVSQAPMERAVASIRAMQAADRAGGHPGP